MIKETELRIGNILLLDNTKVIRLLWVKNNKCCVMEVGVIYPSAIVDIERLQPIELTEEILLKCKHNKSNSRQKQYYINDRLIIISSNGDIIDYASRVRFKYLHKLQNFIYEITSKELEINL